jgi:glutaminyl-peptide cyclotransferase
MKPINRLVTLLLGFALLFGLNACSGETSLAQPPQPTTTLAQENTPDTPTPTYTAIPARSETVVPTTAAPSPTAEAETTSGLLEFDGQRAYADVEHQVALGPRLPGSDAHAQAIEWMQSELEASGWTVELQETTYLDQPVRNVIARRGELDPNRPWIILGAHFDSRFKADNDPDPANHDQPVPGANDGASGVAVLLEMARVLPEDLNQQVWLVFFDSEDQGRLPGWDWIYGSRAFAESLTGQPDAAVIVDMIGDADLNIMMERTSDPALNQEIFNAAADQGHDDVFIAAPGYDILDDHTPFLQKGIPAVDLIDFDYPYWHTISDTPDKVAAESLFAVGDSLLHWLLGRE